MGREWQPGDVAMRTYLGASMRSLRVSECRHDHEAGAHWHHEDGGWDSRDGRSTYRPLVVIDPEDREQVERLTGALVYGGAGKNDDNHWREVQAALREFANPTPPKPDEPTGWLAAVEDGDGRRWYRDGAPNESHPWRELRDDGIHARYVWREIPAVRVLSEGVTP